MINSYTLSPKKSLAIWLWIMIITVPVAAQNVGIGTTTPHPNSILEIKGINKGILIPRGDAMTRVVLSNNTAKGLMMYDTTSYMIWLHNGNGLMSGWQSLSTGTNHWIQSGDLGTEITNTNTGGIWSANPTVVLSDPGPVLPPVSGPGTRMMWIPQKSAFRVGSTDGNHWDGPSIGLFSLAGGLNTVASGSYAIALGTATKATALTSTSWGWFTNASGDISTSFGFKTRAKSYASVALGRWNDSIAISNNTTWINSDPLFMIGNGTSENARHNAMVVYKNGNMILKTPNPFYYNKLPEDYPIPISGEGTRMMWLPEISAFRVGTVSATAWDAENIGAGSFGSGINSIASGAASTAFGFDTEAIGETSFAIGNSAHALSESSVAMGNGTIASGYRSTAFGNLNIASGTYSTSSGNQNLSKGFSSTVVGMYNDSILTTSQIAVDPLTPLFIIGNGDGSGAGQRSNAMVVRKDGNVGIGTSNPNTRMHINGAIKIADGTQGAGKILTSDASGLASWQSPPPPPPESPAYYTSTGICCQSWMTKNLDVSTYRNGDAIPKVTNAAAWAALTTGAYCYYNNDSTTYAATYGKIYNWYAVNDPRGLAPEGWHIPTAFELTTLTECLGGTSVAGGLMKERGMTHWSTPNTGASDLSGFTSLPGGLRSETGTFSGHAIECPLWGSTEYDTADSYFISTAFNSTSATVFHYKKKTGFYVRCIRD